MALFRSSTPYIAMIYKSSCWLQEISQDNTICRPINALIVNDKYLSGILSVAVNWIQIETVIVM